MRAIGFFSTLESRPSGLMSEKVRVRIEARKKVCYGPKVGRVPLC